jgi:hypothetical protein
MKRLAGGIQGNALWRSWTVMIRMHMALGWLLQQETGLLVIHFDLPAWTWVTGMELFREHEGLWKAVTTKVMMIRTRMAAWIMQGCLC